MGPVVTMYEFAPAPGTRTGKIANLEKDLAMALEAQAVRIVAPIPGKAVVGVEVPNQTRETVYLKEILQDSCFTGAASKLQVALGKDIKGAPVSVNLVKMPHLLVAGTTGSGKSVAVNGMITSILYNASPEEVRFIMVDPKMLELSIYEGIPHLLLPVVTDPKKANLALRWAVDEMERRYELLAKTGVRDIASYNARSRAPTQEQRRRRRRRRAKQKKIRVVLAGPDGTEQEVDLDADAEITVAEGPTATAAASSATRRPATRISRTPRPPCRPSARRPAAERTSRRKLPYIVIVIDEFADLMMVAPKDVETSVARLAQKARAAGLHLILATQRPSVDVITGLIKANFPSRIALQVASQDRLAHHPRSGGRRDAARQRRHAVLRSRDQAAPRPRRVSHRRRGAPGGRLPQEAGQAGLRHGHPQAARGGRRGGRRAGRRASTTSSTTRRWPSSARRARRRSRTSSGGCRSATTAPRAWSSRWSATGIVGPTNGAKPREVLAPAGRVPGRGGLGAQGLFVHVRDSRASRASDPSPPPGASPLASSPAGARGLRRCRNSMLDPRRRPPQRRERRRDQARRRWRAGRHRDRDGSRPARSRPGGRQPGSAPTPRAARCRRPGRRPGERRAAGCRS